MTLFIPSFVIAIPAGEDTLSGVISAVAAKAFPAKAIPTANEMGVNFVSDFVFPLDFPLAFASSLTATHVWVA